MKKTIIYLIFASLISLFLNTSCVDELLMNDPFIGEGEALVSAEVSFRNFTSALDDTRADGTPGNALNGIDNLYIFVYDTNGNLVGDVKKYKGTALDLSYNTEMPADGVGVDEPVSTQKTKVSFKLPYGKYRVYAAANIHDETIFSAANKEKNYGTEKALKQVSFDWNPNNIEMNDQMFGSFASTEPNKTNAVPATQPDPTDPNKVYFMAETITVNSAGTTFYAWIRRLASKVTVAYDGSGLENGVYIYVKNVTIHDIAKSCYLGMENKPTESQLLNRRQGVANNPEANYTPSENNTRIDYGKQTSYIYDQTQTGLELYNGMTSDKGSNHTPSANSLFFYENMRGDFATANNKADFDKRQHGSGKDQVGENIRQPDDVNDYKDRVKEGTYIEVEAYYISLNPENVSQGPIKYRFMLGKDVTYNYDAERNYHYKVTLGFKGWANQPDWHIDYDGDHRLEVPPVYRVSYLYQQKSSLPVRISKNCKSLKVEIIENNWAPSDPNTLQFLTQETITSTPADYQFRWNLAAFNSYYRSLTTVEGISVPVNTDKPWLGFLALNMPEASDAKDLPVTVPVKKLADPIAGTPADYWTFKDQAKGQDALKDFYFTDYGEGNQSMSLFEGDELEIGDETVHPSNCKLNSWSVVPVDDGTDRGYKTVMVPLWTRAKTMIEGSGFSGNNPYEYFVRKATLKITATFDMGDDPDEKEEAYVTVLQEPRIVNPKAIWRRGGSGASDFHVLLMTTLNSNQHSDYTPLISDGQWTAYVELGTNVTLSTSESTNGEEKDGKIYGNTGTEVDFKININSDGYAIVTVLYHNNNCVHKILVNQGYEGTVSLGGNEWSNYTLYSATATGTANVYNAVETSNPMILGSLFRRGKITEGILETNNNRANFGPFNNPGTRTYNLTGGGSKTWEALGCEGNNTNPAPMGTFRINEQDYKVPELADYNALKDNCDFALGVLYGDGATKTSDIFATATGFWSGDQDPNKGVRCVIAYDTRYETAHQVVFPLGKDGYGRRTQRYFNNPNWINDANGTLMYSDVWSVLSGSGTTVNNTYRPIPYNLKIYPGMILWLNNRVADGFLGDTDPGPTMSWDINYFNYDFNSFDNGGNENYRDACVIKLIKQKR